MFIFIVVRFFFLPCAIPGLQTTLYSKRRRRDTHWHGDTTSENPCQFPSSFLCFVGISLYAC